MFEDIIFLILFIDFEKLNKHRKYIDANRQQK